MNDTDIVQVKAPEGQTVNVGGRVYPVTALIVCDDLSIPLADIPVMSDEHWNALAASPENQARLREVAADE